jgi:hypothetical protein
MRVFPAQEQSCPKRNFHHPNLNPCPLCDLRDLCAMLFPMRVFPAHKLSYPPEYLSPSNLNPSIPPL